MVGLLMKKKGTGEISVGSEGPHRGFAACLRGRPRGRRVDSRPNLWAMRVVHASAPYGRPLRFVTKCACPLYPPSVKRRSGLCQRTRVVHRPRQSGILIYEMSSWESQSDVFRWLTTMRTVNGETNLFRDVALVGLPALGRRVPDDAAPAHDRQSRSN